MRDVSLGGLGHRIKDTSGERDRQPALCRSRIVIEGQCPLEQSNRLPPVLTRWRLQPYGASPHNVILRIPIYGRPGGFGADQLEVERNRNAVRKLVLQCEQIAGVAV